MADHRHAERPDDAPIDDEAELQYAMNSVKESLRGLRFGLVTIVVQDGVVVQVERTEMRRLRDRRSNG